MKWIWVSREVVTDKVSVCAVFFCQFHVSMVFVCKNKAKVNFFFMLFFYAFYYARRYNDVRFLSKSHFLLHRNFPFERFVNMSGKSVSRQFYCVRTKTRYLNDWRWQRSNNIDGICTVQVFYCRVLNDESKENGEKVRECVFDIRLLIVMKQEGQ